MRFIINDLLARRTVIKELFVYKTLANLNVNIAFSGSDSVNIVNLFLTIGNYQLFQAVLTSASGMSMMSGSNRFWLGILALVESCNVIERNVMRKLDTAKQWSSNLFEERASTYFFE